MGANDDVLKALADLERRFNDRIDRVEQKVDGLIAKVDRLEAKVDVLGTTLLSPHEQRQHEFAALSAKPADGRNR